MWLEIYTRCYASSSSYSLYDCILCFSSTPKVCTLHTVQSGCISVILTCMQHETGCACQQCVHVPRQSSKHISTTKSCQCACVSFDHLYRALNKIGENRAEYLQSQDEDHCCLLEAACGCLMSSGSDPSRYCSSCFCHTSSHPLLDTSRTLRSASKLYL